MSDAELAQLYRLVKRRPLEGTLSAAILVHAQACGLVAYLANVHPDRVAIAVKATQAIAA